MRVLVTGGTGQLGTDVARIWGDAGDHVHALGHADLDITDEVAVHKAVETSRPDVIVNCAAWTAVDDCESDPARSDLINHRAVGLLAGAASTVGAHLLQISTDYVFDGTKVGDYVESDDTNPKSIYGISKLAGEIAAGPSATVVRTSWLCSAHGGNMVATILRLAGTHPELRFVDDQRGNPTFTADLASTLRLLALNRHAGVVHVTNAETVSWFNFAQQVLVAAGHDPARVKPVLTRDIEPARPAPRPSNSALSNDHLKSLGYPPLRNFRVALDDVINAYL